MACIKLRAIYLFSAPSPIRESGDQGDGGKGQPRLRRQNRNWRRLERRGASPPQGGVGGSSPRNYGLINGEEDGADFGVGPDLQDDPDLGILAGGLQGGRDRARVIEGRHAGRVTQRERVFD